MVSDRFLTRNEQIKQLTAALAAERARGEKMREALEAIRVRCHEGDPRSDWLPIITRLVNTALASTTHTGELEEARDA